MKRPIHRGWHMFRKVSGCVVFLMATLASVAPAQVAEAALAGDLEAVKQLVDSGASVDERGSDGDVPLASAMRRGHVEVVAWLLENGADPESLGRFGSTALHIAAERGDLESVRLLLAHDAPPNLVDEDGNTALHVACSPPSWVSGRPTGPVIQALLSAGADYGIMGEYGDEPLSVCAASGVTEGMRALLEAGANVLSRGNGDATPLHDAAWGGALESVALLVEHGAPTDVQGPYDATPVETAAAAGHPDVVAFLLEHDSSVSVRSEIVIARRSAYTTMLNAARRFRSWDEDLTPEQVSELNVDRVEKIRNYVIGETTARDVEDEFEGPSVDGVLAIVAQCEIQNGSGGEATVVVGIYTGGGPTQYKSNPTAFSDVQAQIGRASCRERV